MALHLDNLDDRTRLLMLEELDNDVQRHQLHISPVLSGQGVHDYPDLLREAIERGDEESLAADLGAHRRIIRSMHRRKPSGGYLIAAVPETSPEMVAESAFNRYYIRALCRRAIEDGIEELIIYRAKAVKTPRPQSEALLETTIDPQLLLEELRNPSGEDTSLGVPGGPNSGISVRLP